MKRMEEALEKAAFPKIAKTMIWRMAIARPSFWTQEMKIGAINGVRRTEAGYVDGREVTPPIPTPKASFNLCYEAFPTFVASAMKVAKE